MEAVMESDPDIIFIGGRMSSIYDELAEIAPIYVVYTDTEIGVVDSTAMNAKNIASLFGVEDQIDACLCRVLSFSPCAGAAILRLFATSGSAGADFHT